MKTWFTVMIGLAVLSGCGKTNDAPPQNENEVTERRSPAKADRHEMPDHATIASKETDEIFQRLLTLYPPGKHIPPDNFYKNRDAEKLFGLADRDSETLLAVVDYAKPLMVINPLTFEQWKSRTVPKSLGDGPAPERGREGYRKYLEDCRLHDEARCLLEQKRWIVTLVLQKKAAGDQKFLEGLLRHKNIGVRDFAIKRLDAGAAVRDRNARPIAAYWDGGVHMLGKPPSVLFAAWADGMVVKKVGEKTMSGFVSPEAISKLIATLRTSGVFAASTSANLEASGLLFVDGPVRCLSIADGGRRRTLYYHERYDLNRFDKMHPTASPSRKQCERFVADWRHVLAETAKISPDKLKPFSGDRPLTYPQYAKKPSPPEPAPGE